MSADTRIGYVFSKYPVFEQTFMWREVRELRRNGFDVRPFSLRTPEDSQVKSAKEREELRNTFYLRRSGMTFIAGAHFRFLVSAPVRFVTGLVYALRLSPGGLRSLLWQFFYFIEAGCLVEWARKNRIEHFHAHMVGSACSVALIAAKCSRRTFSLTAHGPHMFDNCDRLCLSEKFAQARTVICISDYCRSQVMRQVSPQHWDKLRVVRCGVDPALFQPRPKQERRDSTTRFLYVGRLASEKGLPLLLHACRTLLDSNLPFKCTVVGDGPDRGMLEALCGRLGLREHVCLVGAIGQDHIQEYYDLADVLVLPSFAEGVPVVLMEAMAKEVPVITTRVMGIPELVEDGVNGLLIPPASVESLAHAMLRLAKDDQLRQRLGKAGREKVIAEYNLETNVTKLAQILQYSADGKLADKKVSTAVIEGV